jgi:hypothetical protein
VRNFCRGLLCTADPAGARAGGVEASSSGMHPGQVPTLHNRQLAVHVGKAGVTLVPGLGKGSVGGFAEELHRTGAKASSWEDVTLSRGPARQVQIPVPPSATSRLL